MAPPRFFSAFRTAARGMRAQRIAMGAATENIANAKTSRTEDGTPYKIKRPAHEVADDRYTRFGSLLSKSRSRLQTSDARHRDGFSLRRRMSKTELGPETEIEEIERERLEYDPSHPHADDEGYVHYPDINVVEEMTRMISANRLYEANLSAVKAAKQMAKQTLQI